MIRKSRNRFSEKIMRKQRDEIMMRFGLIATCSSVGASGSTAHGPVSFAIQRTGGACPARPWPLAAHAADVRFSAMGAFGSPPLRCYNAAPRGTRVGWGCQGRRMGDKHVIMRAAAFDSCRRIALLAAVSFAAGYGMLAAPASSQSLGDRFKSLFGVRPEQPAEAAPPAEGETDLTCPPVSIRAGASTYAVAAPGKQPVGNDLRVQATITRTARDCTKNGDQITAR